MKRPRDTFSPAERSAALNEPCWNQILRLYDGFFAPCHCLQSPFLLLVRVYWGWQLSQNGWAKLHNLDKVTEFFSSLSLPMPAHMAIFISIVRILLRPSSRARACFRAWRRSVLTIDMFMAYRDRRS